MDTFEIIKVLADAPLALMLLYLLVNEQRAHAETRRLRDADNKEWSLRLIGLLSGQHTEIAAEQRVLTRLKEL